MILPYGVSLFITWQLIMLGLKISLPVAFSFGGNGFIIWLPTHVLFLRLLAFLFVTENRAMEEKTNIVKGKQEENEYTMLNTQYIEIEQSQNRLFGMKLFGIYTIFLWESLRESLTKYDITVWSTFGIAIGMTLLFGAEGAMHGVRWWPDQRTITKNRIMEMEENDN